MSRSKAQTISSMRGWSCLPASNPTSLGQARDYRRMDSWNTKTTAQLNDIGLTTARGRDTTHAALHTNSRPTGRNMCVNTPRVRVPHVTVTWVSGVPGSSSSWMPDTTPEPQNRSHARVRVSRHTAGNQYTPHAHPSSARAVTLMALARLVPGFLGDRGRGVGFRTARTWSKPRTPRTTSAKERSRVNDTRRHATHEHLDL